MAQKIENFVNFVTDTITPPILTAAGITEEGFAGNDTSTAEYTKLGWILTCYGDMVKRNLVDGDVDAIVDEIIGINDIESLRSPAGFNLLQIMSYENKSNKEFTIATDLNGHGQEDMIPLALIADNPGGQTAYHMIVDYGMKDLVKELPLEGAGHIDDPGRTGEFLSPWALAMVRGGEEKVSGTEDGPRMALAQYMSAASGEYNTFYGKNPVYSGGGGRIENEISRIIMSSSHEVLEQILELALTNVPGSAGALTPGAVESSGGISAGSVTFDATKYGAGTHESGYHPLYFYLFKYRSGVKKELLDLLTEKFSSLSVSISESGDTEGFTAASLASYYLSITDDGWNNPELAGWVGAETAKAGGSAEEIWAGSGSVRIFTNGSSGNAFGAVTNILVKINDKHNEWWSNQPEDSEATIHDFESLFYGYAGAALPGSIDYDFYRIWMVEFGKEIG